MAAERVPESLNKRKGGVVVEHLSAAITLVSLIQFQQFSESLERDLSNDVFKSKIWMRS